MRDTHHQLHRANHLHIALDTTATSGSSVEIQDYAMHLSAALTALDGDLKCTVVGERTGPRLPFPWRNRRVDLVHSLTADLPRTRRKRIVTVHDLGGITHPEYVSQQETNRQLRRVSTALRAADATITLSNYTRRILLRYMPDLDPARVIVIPPGMSSPASQPEAAVLAEVRGRYGLTEPFILAVGTLEPRQNYLRLIQAFAAVQALAGGPRRLVIAGQRGWQCTPILDEIARLGVGDSITIIADTNAALCDALFALASVVADVAVTTGFSPAVWSALRQGVPMVVSDGGALAELAGDAALIVPYNDVDLMAHALHRASKDEGLRHHLRVRGLARAGQFTWGASAQATLRVYDMIMGRGHATDELAA